MRCAERDHGVGAVPAVEHIVPVAGRDTAEAVRDDVNPGLPGAAQDGGHRALEQRGDGRYVGAQPIVHRVDVDETRGIETLGKVDPRTRVVADPVHENDRLVRPRRARTRRRQRRRIADAIP